MNHPVYSPLFKYNNYSYLHFLTPWCNDNCKKYQWRANFGQFFRFLFIVLFMNLLIFFNIIALIITIISRKMIFNIYCLAQNFFIMIVYTKKFNHCCLKGTDHCLDYLELLHAIADFRHLDVAFNLLDICEKNMYLL